MRADDGRTLDSSIREAIVRTGKIEVLDHQRMKGILTGQNFSPAMCDTTQGIVNVGKMLDVNRVLCGQASKSGDVWILSLYLVDVSTAKLVGTRTVPCEGSMENLLAVSPKVAMQLLGVSEAAADLQMASLSLQAKIPWETYSSKAGHYTIQMPGDAREQPRYQPNEPLSVTCKVSPKELYFVRCYAVSAEGVAKIGATKFFKRLRDDILARDSTFRLRSEREIAIDGHPGLEFIVDDPKNNAAILFNVYVAGNRLYQLMVGVPRGSENSISVLGFFCSFRFL